MGVNETVFQHTEHENKLTASECIRTCAPNHRRAALTSLPGMSRKSESDLSQEESMEVDCNHCVFEDSSELRDLDAADVKDMRLEAQAVVNDVLFAVREMYVAHSLQNAVDVAHINVETREGNRYCLELTEAGLRVVGYAFDQVDESMMTQYHETVYSLLDSLSPAYREAFGNALLQRLERLKQNGR